VTLFNFILATYSFATITIANSVVISASLITKQTDAAVDDTSQLLIALLLIYVGTCFDFRYPSADQQHIRIRMINI